MDERIPIEIEWAYIISGGLVPRVDRASDPSISVRAIQTGEYIVTFPTHMTALGCTGTLNNSEGYITVVPGDFSGLLPNEARVLTMTSDGSFAAYDFTIVSYHALGPRLKPILRPIDTWDNIHVFLTQDNRLDMGADFPLMQRYDFIWYAGRFVHPLVDGYNPSLIVTSSTPFCRDPYGGPSGASNAPDRNQHSLEWYQSTHPDWVVYQCDGVTPAYLPRDSSGTPDTDQVPIDITNPAVIDWQVATFGAPGTQRGEYDGLAADNVDFRNQQHAYGVKRGGTLEQQYSGDVADPLWKEAVFNWLREMRARLHRLSPPQGLIPNVSAIGDLSDAELSRLLDNVDGVLDEAGFLDEQLNRLTETAWLRKIAVMKTVQERGLPYYSINEFGPTPDEAHFCQLGTSVTSAAIQWALASYLMAKDHSASLFISAIQQYGCPLWYAEYDARIGHPVTEMRPLDTVYVRFHSGGVSLVNPSASETFVVTLPVGRTYVDLYGSAVGPNVTMDPTSGLVLLYAT